MLRRVAAAGGRGALSARLAAAGGRSGRVPLIQAPAFQAFHAGVPRQEQAVDKPAPSRSSEVETYKNASLFGENPRIQAIIDAGKLDGAKRLLPFALFLSVPALCREWYVITEETMLMGCFFLFLGAAIDFGGAGVGKFFDDQAAAIKNAQTTAEDNQIQRVASELAVEKGRLAEMQQIEVISKAIASKDVLKEKAEAMSVPHINRDSTVKLLEGLKVLKMKRVTELRSSEIIAALEEVVAKISADKKLKKAALDNALQALADPSKAAKIDPVSQAFVQYWKAKAAEMEKNKNKPIELTPAEIEANEADIRAVFAKVGQDPTEFIASLPKSYTPATPTLFS